tara:strand:+ start:139 stop:591 length:453 start_codon:yes stop_codon:yes gene_type:complete
MYNKDGFRKARAKGFRSGLEQIIAKQIKHAGHKLRYETIKIKWIDFSVRSYTPDFVLDNGIIIEAKGFWSTADRRKHVEIKKQHSDLDIRMVFENSKRKIRKGSQTTYGDWCEKKEIIFCDRVIPKSWLKEELILMPSKINYNSYLAHNY